MGQAKQRGTFEQRRAAAEAAAIEQQRAEAARRAEIERNMTPEERVRRDQLRTRLATMFGIAAVVDKSV